MPEAPGVLDADGLARDQPVREHDNFGMVGQLVLAGDMNLEFAKAPAEADVLVVAEVLVAKHQNAAIMKGGADCGEGGVVDVLRKINPEHLCANRSAEWFEGRVHPCIVRSDVST